MSTGFDVTGIENDIASEDAGQIVHVQGKDSQPLFYGPEGAEQPVTVRIAGSYSKRYRKIEAAQIQRNVKLVRRGIQQLSEEQLLRNRVELVAGCILGWEGFTKNDEPYPFTPENATTLVMASPWFRGQLEAAQHDHEGFTKAPSGN